MTPERILVLLDILERAAKTPALSHLGGAALEALKDAQLYTVEQEEDKKSNPPPEEAPPKARSK